MITIKCFGFHLPLDETEYDGAFCILLDMRADLCLIVQKEADSSVLDVADVAGQKVTRFSRGK